MRFESLIGVRGLSFIGLSASGCSPTKRLPMKTECPFSGKAGQQMVGLVPSAFHQRLGNRADIAARCRAERRAILPEEPLSAGPAKPMERG
jgi:hypothetical protein